MAPVWRVHGGGGGFNQVCGQEFYGRPDFSDLCCSLNVCNVFEGWGAMRPLSHLVGEFPLPLLCRFWQIHGIGLSSTWKPSTFLQT